MSPSRSHRETAPSHRPAAASRSDLLAAFLAVLITTSIPLHAEAAGNAVAGIPPTDALIVLDDIDIDEVWAFIDEWTANGAWLPHVYPPNLIIGSVPPSLEEALHSDRRVLSLNRRPYVPPASDKNARRHALVIASWNMEGGEAAEKNGEEAVFREGGELSCRVETVDGRAAELFARKAGRIEEKQYGRAKGADFFQTSEWVIGRTVVGVVLPSTEGATHTKEEVAGVYSQVRGAFTYLASRAGAYPGAQFLYDLHDSVYTSRNLQYSPPHYRESEWTGEVMKNLGGYDLYVKGVPQAPVYEYLDTLRTRFSTEWAVCLFLPRAKFFQGAGYTAYAYLGGPFLVAPSAGGGKVGPSGTILLSHLIIHEASHLYFALDEYAKGGSATPCRATSGYMGVFNRNSLRRDFLCDPESHQPCAMREASANLCSYSLAMMAAADSDTNGVPDVLDTTPWVNIDSTLGDTITTVSPEISGWISVVPAPNLANRSGTGADGRREKEALGRRNNITFNYITHVIYRIDDQSWQFGDPDGGWRYDSSLVHFRFIPDSLSGGNHVIRIRGVNSVGNESTGGFEKKFDLFVKAVALRDFEIEADYGGKVRLSFNIFGGAFGSEATLYRTAPSPDTGLPETDVVRVLTLSDDTAYEVIDEQGRPGDTLTYEIVVRGLGLEWSWEKRFVKQSPIERSTYLSIATPNPFRDRTVISFRVPRGPRIVRPGGGGKPGGTTHNGDYRPDAGYAPPAGKTSVRYRQIVARLDIYNIAGRRVRHYPPTYWDEGFVPDPVIWDGRDDRGNDVPQGVYFIHFSAGDDVRETRKIVLIR